MVEDACVTCHRTNGIGPFPLETYEDVARFISMSIYSVERGKMPPWPASDDCNPIARSRHLDDETRSLFRRWRDGGMLRGDPQDFVPPAERDLRPPLSSPSLTIEMAKPYVPIQPGPGEPDEQRCFLLPETIEKETYMRALEVLPGTGTVHHLQIHRIPAEAVAEAEAREAESPGPGYPCAGGSASGAYNLFSWHPGAEVIRFDEDTAAYLSPGSRLLLQTHFNIDILPAGEPIPAEKTRINLWLLPDGEIPPYVVVRFFLAGGDIHLPPGESSVISQADTRMGDRGVERGNLFAPGEFIGHTPHMHWLGKEFKVEITRPNGDSTCLIDVPAWDFEWQLDYWYDEKDYIPFGPEDIVNVSCNYDNSRENQPFIRGIRQEPRLVEWGPSSADEMCLNHTWVRYKREDYLAARNVVIPEETETTEETPPADPEGQDD